MSYLVAILAVLNYEILSVSGHAIFFEPPSRSSFGQYRAVRTSDNKCNVPQNYDHMSLWCGGIAAQHDIYGGKCDICGDGYGDDYRPNRYPGKYATGIISRSYFEPGQVIDVNIDVVANHKGFFYFQICPHNDPDSAATRECFEDNRLKYEDGADVWYIPQDYDGENCQDNPDCEKDPFFGRAQLRVKLPDGMECWHCILQWTYITGNRWGIGPQGAEYATQDCIEDEEGKLGCGPQETFRGCADICIGPGCPTEECQRAEPFDDTTPSTTPHPTQPPTPTQPPPPNPTTTSAPTTAPTTVPITSPTTDPLTPPGDKICVDAGIREEFFSSIGNDYCKTVCVGKKQRLCNLYLCWCKTD